MKIPSIDKYLGPEDLVIKPGKHSKEQISIPCVISENSGGIRASFNLRKHILPRMLGCLLEAKKSASSIKNNPKPSNKQISEKKRVELESFIKSLGINEIGYTKVNPDLIFQNRVILYDHAIVITMEMKQEAIGTERHQRLQLKRYLEHTMSLVKQ